MSIFSSQNRRKWLKALKWTAIVAGSLVALLLFAVTVAVSYLTPERLTPIVNRYASEYLLADVRARRVELSFWSTFPRFEIGVDSLTVDSRALEGLSPEALGAIPADARRLAQIERFAGALSIPALLAGKIHIHDVEIVNPRVNIVSVTPETANYLIVPPSDNPDETPDTESTRLPDIVIDRFAIIGEAPVRYYSAADSIDALVTLRQSRLKGTDGTSAYHLEMSGAGSGSLGELVRLEETAFGLNGKIEWNPARPLAVAFRDFRISLETLALDIDASLDMTDVPVIETLRIATDNLSVADALALIPAGIADGLDPVDTDLRLDLDARLTKPFRLAADTVPSAEIRLGLKGKLAYGRMNPFDIEADIAASVNGSRPDSSVVDIRQLRVIGRATGFKLNAKITNPLSDPSASGRFEGGLSFDALPRKLYDRLNVNAGGLLTAETDFRFRMSDLGPRTFHRMRLDGVARLRKFHANTPDSAMTLRADGATLRFGTASTLAMPRGTADSLLTVSLFFDTVSGRLDHGDYTFAASDLRAGIGARNVASSSDTSLVNPVGARISAGRIFARSALDSMTVRLTDISAGAALTRFNGNARAPRLALKLDAGRLRYTDPANRAALRRAHFDLAMHLRGRDSSAVARRAARLDSMRAVYPGASDDSIRSILRRRRMARREADSAAIAAGELIDFEVDRSLARRLRRIDLRGSLTVGGGRLMSHYFPLRSRLNGLGMRFTADSVIIDSARMSVGRSHINLTGEIAGISRAITSPGRTLQLRFNVFADTVDVNEITNAVFAGAGYASGRRPRPRLTDATEDDAADASITSSADSAERTAVVIPSNVDAELSLRADRVSYSDLWLRNLRGNIAVHDGALSLDRLSGSTDIGSLNLTALYEAPDTANLRFSAGIIIDRLQLNSFLAMMPQLDSIMPLLRDVDGIIDAEIALTSKLDGSLDLLLPSLDAMLRLSGDSLVLLDSETFATIGKWLMFKNRRRNVIDHMDVELMVRDSRLDLYPFMFDIDRYRLGVSGTNDLDLNLDYHIAVLKSPLPFRFGVNIKGTPEKMKIRLGRARFDEKRAYAQRQLTDTARINLLTEISEVFRRGVKRGGASARLRRHERPDRLAVDISDTISHSDSLLFIREGLIDTVTVGRSEPSDVAKP